jgi:molybdopterin converting factor small subunit
VAKVVVRYWAGARRAAGVDSEVLCVDSVAALRSELARRSALTRISEVAAFLVDGRQAGDDTQLPDGAEVDVLPPFAGG